MKIESPNMLKQPLFWLVLLGSIVSIVSTVIAEAGCIITLTATIGSLLSLTGGVWAIIDANPKIFHFSDSDWQKGDSDYCYLYITSKMHKKGNWPTYKILDNTGETIMCDKEYIRENGDIEFRIPKEYVGVVGRLHVK